MPDRAAYGMSKVGSAPRLATGQGRSSPNGTVHDAVGNASSRIRGFPTPGEVSVTGG
jgi:hypothetical protein